MQVTESSADGLKREISITVEARDLDERLSKKLEQIKRDVRLKGFRPGKVPVSHLRKTFGKQVMSEVIQETVGETSQKALADRALRPALQPEIDIEGELEPVVEGKADLAYKMTFEIIPDIELADFAKIGVERPVAEVSDADVGEALERLAAQQKNFEPKGEAAVAASGDLVTIDFVGKVDGEAFEGGSAEDSKLELGAGQFIPGFEDQLVGAKAGDAVEVKVTFPEEYGAQNLAGKDAVFDVTVKAVEQPAPVTIDEDLAQRFGMENLAKLRETVTQQIETDFARVSRDRMKRNLLDKLDETHQFEVPPKMLEQEFEQIWHQFEHELEHQGKTIADADEPEEDLRADYRKIAERRVRLGLILAEVGDKNEVKVADEEVNRALAERARQFPGQEREVYDFYQKNPQAVAQLRAPIFEDKVVDFIAELADVTDRKVSREDLFADPDGEDHGHHNHDHDHDEPAKKAAKKDA